MDNELLEKLLKMSEENGMLKKEVEMLKIANSILEDKLSDNLNNAVITEKELNVLVNTLDLLFNIRRKVACDDKRVNYSGKEKIYEDYSDKKIIKEKVLKKDLF